MFKNRQTIFNAAIAVSLASFFIYFFLIRNEKIAYVDSAKLLNGYKAMTDARGEYEKKATTWKANVDTLMNDVQNQIKKYERAAGSMSASERQMAQELIRTKQKQLNDYQQALQQTAGEEDARLTQKVVSQVNSFLERYGKKHSYKIILVANQTGNIAYASEGMDITEKVVEELNNEYSKPAK